ncbi:MAG: glycosyltransferase [Thermoanaerobaculum sp.]|nr:glycosyltransferase [Thermoanaerobaculum sp.]MDW7966603.1 glycosyltransferase [Thermoanaerobaculum sp.]
MRVLHLVAADRWTGAAATALQAVEALREAGVDAHLAFRPGRNLQTRLAGFPWAHPILEKERSWSTLARVLRQLRQLLQGFDLLHTHLPHDHLLALWARRGFPHPPQVVRSVHHPSHLRRDPYHRLLFRSVAGVGLAHSEMLPAAQRLAPQAPVAVLPLALEPRFTPMAQREAIRQELGIPRDAFVAGTVGKLDPTRGQDLLLLALGAVPESWGLVVGKGPFLPRLEKLAKKLGINGRVLFPGYHEEGLERLYNAMDLFIFPEPGSDWAHRAVAEAAACGVPSLAVDVPGIRDLVEPGVSGELWPRGDAAALAVLIQKWKENPQRCREAGSRARQRVQGLTSAALSRALMELYQKASQP